MALIGGQLSLRYFRDLAAKMRWAPCKLTLVYSLPRRREDREEIILRSKSFFHHPVLAIMKPISRHYGSNPKKNFAFSRFRGKKWGEGGCFRTSFLLFLKPSYKLESDLGTKRGFEESHRAFVF
jgi:hypothetical protein